MNGAKKRVDCGRTLKLMRHKKVEESILPIRRLDNNEVIILLPKISLLTRPNSCWTEKMWLMDSIITHSHTQQYGLSPT